MAASILSAIDVPIGYRGEFLRDTFIFRVPSRLSHGAFTWAAATAARGSSWRFGAMLSNWCPLSWCLFHNSETAMSSIFAIKRDMMPWRIACGDFFQRLQAVG
jgi:hypothetical protein